MVAPRPRLDEVDLELTHAAVREGLFGDARRPTKIGRFEVEGTAGAGGMGRVYVATDPNLQRRVALKLIAGAEDPDEARVLRQRLVEEAQALASLNHPNVVVAYEVGTAGDDVFLAMEYAPGVDLRRWLRTPRTWTEVRDVFAQAGEGLAAAHDAGVVHRDFKPDNVLVGEDGRVRVLDFGLAVASAPFETDGPRGSRAGTPGYVAPEVLAGRSADARSDQFAFCRSLQGGLERTGRTPAWLAALVERGLDDDPAARHPSMHALIAAMRRDPTARRRKVALGAGAFVLVAGVVGYTRWADLRRAEACQEAAGAAGRVWEESAHAEVREAFAATELASAGLASQQVSGRLDAWVSSWAAARTAACPNASDVAPSPSLRLAARQCLDRALTRLSVVVETLQDPDRDTVLAAIQIVGGLPRPKACIDDDALRRASSGGSVPSTEAVAAIDRRLARAETRRVTGQLHPARQSARAALTEAEALGWPPLVIQARRQLGAVLLELGEHEASRRELRAAYLDAQSIGRDDLAAEATSGLVVLERAQGRLEAARLWADLGFALWERLGQRQSVDVATLLQAYAQVQLESNELEGARESHREALALRREQLGEGHPRVAASLIGLGNVAHRSRQLPAALAHFAEAKAVIERTMGEAHPLALLAAGNIAAIHLEQDRPEQAAAAYERVLEVRRSIYGEGHRSTAIVRQNLGGAYFRLGRLDDAEREMQAALEIQRRTLGSDHAAVASTLGNLAAVAFRRGKPQDALGPMREAIEINSRARGPDDPELIEAWTNVAQVHVAVGDLEAAGDALAKASAIAQARLQPDDLRWQSVHVGLAELTKRLGDPQAAIGHLERALPLLRAAGRDARAAELETEIASLRDGQGSAP